MTLRGESLFTATIYLCNNESRENSIIKVAQKNIYIYYVCFLGTIGCSSPNKVAHVWRFTFDHKSSGGAFRLRMQLPIKRHQESELQ